MLVLGVPVIKCFLCFGIGDLGVDEEAVVGEVEGGETVCSLVGFFVLVLADQEVNKSNRCSSFVVDKVCPIFSG